MANPLTPISKKSLKSGLITINAVSENDYPVDALLESINFNYDTIGKMTLRLGSTIIGSSLGSSVLGIYNFRDSGSGTNNQLISVAGSSVYYLSGGVWTAIRTVTSGLKARFSTFLDYVFMVNGTDATAVWDGNPSNLFVTTGNAASAPIGKYIENFRSRVWIAGNPTYPDRLYYTSIPSAVTTPVVIWDTSVTTGQWIDISPSDGENITALHRTKVALLVFKPNHIYQVYSVVQIDPDPKIDVGTWSQESIVESKNGVYFHHPTGFYRYANGGVQEISQPIIDVVKNISYSNYSKIAGWIEPDGNHICWAIGNVTYDGISYSNMVVRYTISSGTWTHYSYPTQFVCSSPYDTGTALSAVVGDTAGGIHTINSGLTDNGSEIFYSITHPYDGIDGLNSTVKIVNTMFFMHKNMAGANVNYQNESDITNDYTRKVGQLSGSDTGFSNLSLRGRKLRFRLTGTSKGQPMSYEGYEILAGTTQLITFK